MAFPTGWNRYVPITIDHTKIAADVANFPVLISHLNLPTGNNEIFDADGTYPARADGGDIRASSDSAGASQLPVEVYYFLMDNTPANGRAEIWVKVTSVSSTVDTVIYIWYNAPTETLPARTNTYGSDNVWDSNFKFVSHQGASFADSTSAATAGTNHSTTDDATQTLIGISSRKYVRASSQYIDYGEPAGIDISGDVDITVEFIARLNSVNSTTWQFIGKNVTQYYFEQQSNNLIYFGTYDGGWVTISSNATLATNTWGYFAGTRTASNNTTRMLRNGVAQTATGTIASISSNAESLLTGAQDDGGTPNRFIDGWLEETRISNSVRSNAWISSTHNNTSAANTFATAGTPVSPTATTYATSMRIVWF